MIFGCLSLPFFFQGLDKTDEDYTVDEVFISRAQMDESDAKQAEKDKQHAIKEYKQQSRALEGCNRCLDNRETIKHLIVSVGSKVISLDVSVIPA